MTGSPWGDFAIKQGSAWLAFENELGVQEPVGFWDPAGFTADGSVEDFKRRRQTELKHGRISMLATMGYITPETLVSLERGGCWRLASHFRATTHVYNNIYLVAVIVDCCSRINVLSVFFERSSCQVSVSVRLSSLHAAVLKHLKLVYKCGSTSCMWMPVELDVRMC